MNFSQLFIFITFSLVFKSVSSAHEIQTSHHNVLSRSSSSSSSDCHILKTGTLLLVSNLSNKRFNVGLSTETKEDSNCEQATFLTTKIDGEDVPGSKAKFDFQVCKSNFLGFKKKSGIKYGTYYGRLFPQDAKKHCLTLRSGEISPASTLISDSECDFTDDELQLLNHFSYTDGEQKKLNFLGYTKDEEVLSNQVTIGTSGAVHIRVDGKAPEGSELFHFVFV